MTEDELALTYAGAYLQIVGKRPAAEVAVVINDRRAQQRIIKYLVMKEAWRNDLAPTMRSVYTAFNAIGPKGRARALRRVIPELRPREITEVLDREETGAAESGIRRASRVTHDPLEELALSFREQFALFVQAIIRQVADGKDARRIVRAMAD